METTNTGAVVTPPATDTSAATTTTTEARTPGRRRHGGVTTVRMDPEVHERISLAAAAAGQTLNEYLLAAIMASLDGTVERLNEELAEAKRTVADLASRLGDTTPSPVRDEPPRTELIVEVRPPATVEKDEEAEDVGKKPGACQHAGCNRMPTGRKPYCVDHVGEMPYVARLIEEIARREALDMDEDDESDAEERPDVEAA